MGSTIRYDPKVHCWVCIAVKQVTATRTFEMGGRDYHTCETHAELMERHTSIHEAAAEARQRRTKQGGAA